MLLQLQKEILTIRYKPKCLFQFYNNVFISINKYIFYICIHIHYVTAKFGNRQTGNGGNGWETGGGLEEEGKNLVTGGGFKGY